MCSIEAMIGVSLYKMNLEEEAKKLEREEAKAAAARGLGSETLRRSQEEESLEVWFDIEGRKIEAAAGETKVAAADAGVRIAVLNDQWTQAHVELYGSKVAASKRSAAAGEVRTVGIIELKEARLKAAEKSSPFGWAMAIGQGIAMGIQMEEAMGGWDGKVFGQKIWTGGDIASLGGDTTASYQAGYGVGPFQSATPETPWNIYQGSFANWPGSVWR